MCGLIIAATEEDAGGEQQPKGIQSGSSSWRGCSQDAFWSDHVRLVLTRDSTRCIREGAAPESCSSSDFCIVKSCRCWTAHVGERRTVAGAGTIREQVTSEWSKRATCRGYYSCCTDLLPFCSLLHYKSGFLSTWMGLVSNGVGLFLRERVLKNMPTPPLWAAT